MRRVAFWLASASVASGLLVPGTAPAQAPDWVKSVVPQTSHEFGTVAAGSKVRHSFKVINTTGQDLHIRDWRTKCGCTEVRVGSQDVPPGTQTLVEAVLDTTKFRGYKPSGLTLIIDKPQYAEIDLNLSCFIRTDLSLSPGGLDFGAASRASSPKVAINLTYSGSQADWEINKMHTQSPHVTAKLDQVGKSAGGATQYVLSATLNPSVPNGFFKDEITLFTNDPNSPTIPVSVTANVQSTVAVTPSPLNLGRVKPGEVVKKTLLVRSEQPFKLTSLKSTRPEVEATPADAESKPRHTVTLTFTAPKQAGAFSTWFEIGTDLKDEPPTRLTAFATVAP